MLSIKARSLHYGDDSYILNNFYHDLEDVDWLNDQYLLCKNSRGDRAIIDIKHSRLMQFSLKDYGYTIDPHHVVIFHDQIYTSLYVESGEQLPNCHRCSIEDFINQNPIWEEIDLSQTQISGSIASNEYCYIFGYRPGSSNLMLYAINHQVDGISVPESWYTPTYLGILDNQNLVIVSASNVDTAIDSNNMHAVARVYSGIILISEIKVVYVHHYRVYRNSLLAISNEIVTYRLD